MKSKILLLALIAIASGVSLLKAQVNIGSASAPNASAQLQISGSTKGVLFPKVALSSTTTFTLAGNTKTAGLTVYNTTAGITGNTVYPATGVGLYTWDGSGWVTGNGAVNPNALGVALYLQGAGGATVISSSNTITPIVFSALYNSGDFSVSGSTITVNKAGTYLATLQASFNNVASGSLMTCGIIDGSTGQWIGRGSHYSATATTGNSQSFGEMMYVTSPVTLAAGATVKFAASTATSGALILAQETSNGSTAFATTALLQRIAN